MQALSRLGLAITFAEKFNPRQVARQQKSDKQKYIKKEQKTLKQGIIKQENGHAGLSSKDYLETVNSDIVISFRNFKSVRVPFEK